MSGTIVRDALAPNLFVGATLNATGDTNGTAWEAVYPGEIQFELVTGTVTGTSPTLNVELEASDSSTFASGVVSLGRFATVGDEDLETRQFTSYTDKRYVRAAVVITGTSPVYTGSTLTPVPVHDRRSATTSA